MPNRSAYIYHPYGVSMDDSSDEVVLLPQSPIEDMRSHSPTSYSSHDNFFESTSTSPFPYEEKELPLQSRYIPHNVDFFSTQEMQSKFHSSFDDLQTDERYYQWQTTDTLGDYTGLGLESSSDSEDSDFEMDEDIRSASPSICATARKVKITPLRAVRRSVRRSSLPDSEAATCGIQSSAGNEGFSFFKLAEPHPISPRCLTQKLSVDNLKRMILPWKTSELVDPLHNPQASSSRSNSETERAPLAGDITVIELHDVTQEAVRIAEMMRYKWKFEPAEPVIPIPRPDDPSTQKFSGFFRRRSC